LFVEILIEPLPVEKLLERGPPLPARPHPLEGVVEPTQPRIQALDLGDHRLHDLMRRVIVNRHHATSFA
jgi:hypothetical protein